MNISFVGYASLKIDSINVRAERADFNLADIRLSTNLIDLQSVIIYAEKPLIQSKDGKALYAGTFRVNPSAKPAAIDFEHTEGVFKGKTWKGIYRLDANTLTICDNAPELNKGRPTAFEAKSKSGYVLITFKRANS